MCLRYYYHMAVYPIRTVINDLLDDISEQEYQLECRECYGRYDHYDIPNSECHDILYPIPFPNKKHTNCCKPNNCRIKHLKKQQPWTIKSY